MAGPADSEREIVTAALLVIGDEILSGRTKDKNIGYVAEYLTNIGIDLKEVRVVADEEPEIVAALNVLRARYTYVFTTGGIGPTHDDITSECVAKAFGVKWVLHPETHKIFKSIYKPEDLNEARLRMAHTPEGATLIINPVSRAPGFKMGNVYVMAGIPGVMQAMFDSVQPTLKGGPPVLSRTVSCDLPEGTIAKGLGAIQARYADVDIGSYPFYRRGSFGTSLVLRGREPKRLDQAAQEVLAMVKELGGAPTLE